jgi:hypothetical protein
VPRSQEPGTYDDGVRVVRCPDTATAVAGFRRWAARDAEARRILRGHDGICWSPLDQRGQRGHAGVLLEVANRWPPAARGR